MDELEEKAPEETEQEFSEVPAEEIPEEAPSEEIIEAEEAVEEPTPDVQSELPMEDADVDATLESLLEEFGTGILKKETPPEPEEPAEEPEPPAETPEEPAESTEEPQQYAEYAQEGYVPNPIIFQPPSRLRQLRKQLVVGPEHRYYELTEQGLGKLVLAIGIMGLVLLFTCFTTYRYFSGSAPENRMRFLVFSQVFGILVAAIFGSGLIVDGVGVIFKGKFSLNTLLALTLIACCVDAYFCLSSLQLPFGAAMCFETLLALIANYEKRSTEIGEMDTMRKAVRLDALALKSDYYDGKAGILTRDGDVEEFMDNYRTPSGPKKAQNIFALLSVAASIAIGVTAYFLQGMGFAIRAIAASLLCSLPATAFIALPRPKSILEQRLHRVGAVLCSWEGIRSLRKKLVFPLQDTDLFPIGNVKLNGVKVWHGTIEEVIGYAAALAEVQDCSLLPIFRQLRETRNGSYFDVSDFCFYEAGGIGGIIGEEAVLMGTQSFMEAMEIELPKGSQVENAVYLAIGKELSAVFALTYTPHRTSGKAISTLCGFFGLMPTFVGTDFEVGPALLKKKYRIRTKRLKYAPLPQRPELKKAVPDEDAPAMVLITKDTLAAKVYSVAGARALCSCSRAGAAVHIIAGALGLAMMAAIAIVGAADLLTAANILLYQLIWVIPALLITERTRIL